MFVAALTAVLYFTHQFTALTLGPRGIHFIRQSDCLSFASNYHHFGYGLLSPHVYSLETAEGAAACEFPLLYYMASLLYVITGESFAVMRIIHLSIICFGFLAAFNMLHRHITPSHRLNGGTEGSRQAHRLNGGLITMQATLLTLLSVTSTVVLYYASNFTVDGSALGLTLMGLNFFDLQRSRRSGKHLVLALLCFALACLLKITFAIWPLALIGAVFLSERKRSIRYAWTLLLPACVGALWFSWAAFYNRHVGDNYFLTSSIPIWQLNAQETAQLFDAVTHYWVGSYYAPIARIAIAICVIICIIQITSIDRFYRFVLLMAFCGMVCYFLLLARAFINHDYYMLPAVPLVLLVMIPIGKLLNTTRTLSLRLTASALLLTVCIASTAYSAAKLEKRYHNNNDPFDDAALSLSNAMAEGLSRPHKSERAIVVGDPTRNGCLLMLGVKGISYPDLRHFASALENKTIPAGVMNIYSTAPIDAATLDAIGFAKADEFAPWFLYRLNR